MRGIISWNGKRSDQYGIEVENYPNIVKPQRKFDKYTVPGRNGDIIMMQDAWENVERKYDIFAGDGAINSISSDFSEITEWLYEPTGYAELWDSFDPEHYRMAYFTGSLDINALAAGRIGKTSITFNCKPQRYLIDGKAPINILSQPWTIYNHTGYESKPIIFIERSEEGEGTVSVNGTVFTISEMPSTGMYIDCEECKCYDVNGTNMNSIVSSNTKEFAKLAVGPNSIGFNEKVESVTITPRWFEI